jgi:AsmA protein
MQAVIDQNLAKEKAELEAKAKEKIEAEKKKLEAKVKEKLGVSSQDGQSVEDAVRQKIEEEAKKGLLNLLGKK